MKVLKVVGIVVGAVALVATGIGLALGPAAIGPLGIAGATWTTIGAVAGVVGGVIGLASAVFAPKASFSNDGNPLQFQTNPQSGLPYVIGRTMMAGLKIAGKTANSAGWPKDDLLFFVALLSCTPIASVESFAADNVTISFNGSTGQAVTSGYSSWMSQKVSLGPTPQTTALSLTLNSVAMPGWDAGCKLSGMAHAQWSLRYDTNGNHYEGGVPDPAWVINGRLCYDPRKDSTYPGGSGSHRSNDESTWEWTRNAGLHGLTWCIGRYANGKKVAGIGAPIANIRVADFVECANVCDANAWGCGGVEYTTSTKWDTLTRILQAGGAVPTMSGAMIGCRVQTPRVSIATITADDILDDIVYPAMKARRDRFNSVLPRYVSEASAWQIITGSAITVSDYVTADGGLRSQGIDFLLVQSEVGQAGFDGEQQVGQLSRYAIEQAREAGPLEFTTNLKFVGVYTGDCVTLDVPEEGFDAVKVVITGRSLDPAGASIHFTAETETDAKHPFALGDSTTPPPAPTLTAPPAAVSMPDPDDWTVTAITLADGQSGLRLAGTIADPVADSMLVELSAHSADAWAGQPTLVGSGPLSLDMGPIDGSASWDVRIAYVAAGRHGDWLEFTAIGTGPSKLAGIEDGATVGMTTVQQALFDALEDDMVTAQSDIADAQADILSLFAGSGGSEDLAAAIAAAEDARDAAIAAADDAGDSATAADGDATAAAGSASAASSSATSAAGSATAASGYATAAASSASSAAGSASAASTSASGASTSATNASNSAASAATSATNASSSAGSASTSASTATTQASNASSSATAAAGSASAAAGSATSASSSAGAASTSASTASSQASVATGAASAAQSSATLAASVGVRALNANSAFLDYPALTGEPTSWYGWSGSATRTRVAGELPNTYALQETTTSGVDQGGAQGHNESAALGTVVAGQYVVLEGYVRLDSGSLQGAGCYFNIYASDHTTWIGDGALNFYYDPDSSGAAVGAGVVGKTYRFSKLLGPLPAGATDMYIYRMTGWTGMGTVAAKQLTWYRCLVRPATAEEIRSGTVIPSLQSTVSTQGSTLASLGTLYASLNSLVATQQITIEDYADAIETIEGNVTTLFGRAGVKVDVGGRMTGWEINNNGTTGNFKIHADYFSIEKPGGGARTEYSDGNWRVYDSSGTLRVQMGIWT